MAITYPNLRDALQDKECQAYTSMVPENASEIFNTPTVTPEGFEYQILVETKKGSFNFRDVNETSGISLPEYDVRAFRPTIGNPVLEIPIELWELGSGNGKITDYITRMKKGIIEGVIDKLGRQYYYGTSEDSKGFTGIAALTLSDLTFSNGGNDATNNTSAYAIKYGEDGVTMAYFGMPGKNFSWSPFQPATKKVTVGGVEQMATVMQSFMTMYPAVIVSNPYSVSRLGNIGTALDDDDISAWISHMEDVGFTPDAIYMRPKTRRLLQQSRTTYSPTGSPALVPTDVEGIPLVTTLSLSATEAVISATAI